MSGTVNPLAASAMEPPPLSTREGARAGGSKLASGKVVAPESDKLCEAARQFEAVFVRQLLKASKFGEDMGESGYGGMALEALADGVTKQGGLGLARAIEDALRQSTARADASAKRGDTR